MLDLSGEEQAMFSLRSNGLAWAAPLHPGGGRFASCRPTHSLAGGSFMTTEATATPPRKGRGGRPKGDPSAVRTSTIGVRVSAEEYAALRAKAEQMGMAPAQWLREAALSRRLPSPPVSAVNREQYAELARLAANLNQLSANANAGQPVNVTDELLQHAVSEVKQLRLALIGVKLDS